MIPPPGQPVAEPPRKKRVVTEAMRAANQANSRLSTGPKTAAGKAAVAVNALRHGQTCKELMFLEDEDPAQFWDEVDRWVRERGAKTSDEIALVETAVYSRWTRRRAQNAQVWATKEAVDGAKNGYDDRKTEEVTQLITELASEPRLTVCKLMNSTQGCAFLISQFTLLGKRLITHTSFEVSQRAYALQLSGYRPGELFTNPRVMEINRSYFGAIRGVGGFPVAIAAQALMDDRPEGMTLMEFERSLEPMVNSLPTIPEGHAQLKTFVANAIEQLQDRMELIELREEKAKKAAMGKAQSDITPDGERRARYMAMSDRTLVSSLGLLLKLKKDRKESESGEEEPEDDDCTPEIEPARNGAPGASGPAESIQAEPSAAATPAPQEPVAGPAHAVQEELQNKAVATQVVGGMSANNASPPSQAAESAAPADAGEQELEAARAFYRQTLEKLDAHLKERTETAPSGAPPEP
jgi:hypothetical protein